jgi:hypothetical protein
LKRSSLPSNIKESTPDQTAKDGCFSLETCQSWVRAAKFFGSTMRMTSLTFLDRRSNSWYSLTVPANLPPVFKQSEDVTTVPLCYTFMLEKRRKDDLDITYLLAQPEPPLDQANFALDFSDFVNIRAGLLSTTG